MENSLTERFRKIMASTPFDQEAYDKRQAEHKAIEDKMLADKIRWRCYALPERFRDVFNNGTIDESRISNGAKKYVADKAWEKNAWLVIAGSESGKGKSFDSAWVAWNFIKETQRYILWTMPEGIITGIMTGKIEKDIKKVSMLIIDDFDKFHSAESDTAYKKNLIHGVIDARMDIRIFPTIITANADRKMLENIYTPYIVRRIWEASEGYRDVK
jgi:DNA replication protein DnaC